MRRTFRPWLLCAPLALAGCATDPIAGDDEATEPEIGVIMHALTTKDANTSGGNGLRWDFEGVTAYLSAFPNAYELSYVNKHGSTLWVTGGTYLKLECSDGTHTATVQGSYSGTVANGATWEKKLSCPNEFMKPTHVWVHSETSFHGVPQS